MQNYEVEIKSLLGTSEKAHAVREALKRADAACELRSRNKQLNHYFEGGNIAQLATTLASHLTAEENARLQDLLARGSDFSVRSREKDGEVIFVVKASVDDTTSANGIARMEFEATVDLSLDTLDQLILVGGGYRYQAKWSREREEYVCRNTTVTLDKNAGYGWLAELEKVVDDTARVDQARSEVRQLMDELGLEELPRDRLERMFAHYNAHWPEYYGTDKIFVIE